MTTREDIKQWLDRAPKGTHWMLVICDTFDHSDFPVYFSALDPKGCTERAEAARNGVGMQRLMECYDLTLPIPDQLAEHRAMHLPKEI